MLPDTKDAMCILHPDYLFSSFFLHWHREDTPDAVPSQTPPASKILKGEEVSKSRAAPTSAARQRKRGGGEEAGRLQERTASTSLSDHSRDSDNEQQLRQEGGMIEKGGKKIITTHQSKSQNRKARPKFTIKF